MADVCTHQLGCIAIKRHIVLKFNYKRNGKQTLEHKQKVEVLRERN